MKTMKILFTLVFVAAFSTVGFGQITGSAHDFSGFTWSGGEICIACHTPHNADGTVPNVPLWNHELSAVATYTLYSSNTLNATMGQPSGSSKLCLSCHDGTVALENFGGATGGITFVSTGNVGTNISDDHPISFDYDDALATADGELATPSSALSGLGGTIAADMLFGGQMQCGSCHDVHNGEGVTHLLLKTNAASALCLTCHTK